MRQDATAENLNDRLHVDVAPFSIKADYPPQEFRRGNGGIATVQGISLGKEACAGNTL
jgi:hypothetical protein